MKLKNITSRVAALFTAAVMVITSMPATTVFADIGSWTDNGDGSYSYTQGNVASAEISFPLELPSGMDWADINYVSVKVTADNTVQPAIGGDFDPGATQNWINGTSVMINGGGECTVYLETNKEEVNDLTLQFWTIDWPTDSVVAESGTNITISEITFSSEDMPDPVGEWFEKDDGTWCYQNGGSDVGWINDLTVDTSSVSDWSQIKHISAEITTTEKVNIGFGGESHKIIDGSTDTVYLATNGTAPTDAKLTVEWYDQNVAVEANNIINVKFTFSTEDMPDPVGQWFEKDGALCYQNGSNASGWVERNLLEYANDNGKDWATTKYVSATVEGTGGASMGISMNFTGNDTDWEGTGEKALSSTPVKLCLATNGKTPVYATINTQSIPANASVKITDITFHDTFDDYEGPTGSWYQLDDCWYYQNGDSNVGWIDNLPVDTSSVSDWSQIKYISAEITSTKKISPGFKDRDQTKSEGNTVTVYLDTNGTQPTNPELTFGWYDNIDQAAVEANDLIKVKFDFSTQARTAYDEWYEVEEGVWKYVDSADGIAGNGNTSFCLNDYTDVDLTGVKYVSATVIVENGSAETCFSANNADYSVCKDGSSVSTNNGTNTSYMFCYEGDYTKLMYGIWEISDGATVTLKDLSFSKTDLTNYEDIVGQIVQTSENSYYYNGGDANSTDVVLPLVYDGNMADVQTITMTTRISGTGSIDLGISGSDENDGWVEGYNFPVSTTEMTVTRKYRGCIYKNPLLHIKTFGPGYKVYVSDIIFDTTPVEVTYTNPNDILIDDNTSIINDWNSLHEIDWAHLSKIEVPGTLKINVEFVDNQTYPDLHMVVPVLNEWSDTCNIVEGGWMQITDEAIFMQEEGYCEVPITAEYIDIIQNSAKNECEFAVAGLGIIVTEVIFTPDSTVEKPKQEKVTADKVTTEDKKELENSKNNTHDEKAGKDKAKDGKIQGHKYHKKDKNGKDIYSLRIVKMVDKELLKHAKDVTITVYSKKADRYVTFTADCCFSYLNIYGEKVKAGGDHAFLTVIIDNVHADDEITFTDFTINYKK